MYIGPYIDIRSIISVLIPNLHIGQALNIALSHFATIVTCVTSFLFSTDIKTAPIVAWKVENRFKNVRYCFENEHQ